MGIPGLCFRGMRTATPALRALWSPARPQHAQPTAVTYHGGAPVGHHGSGGSGRAHLWGHVVQTGIGGARAGQLAIEAGVGRHPEWGRVWAGHRQGRPQASCCKKTQATCDSTICRGPAWLVIPGLLLVSFIRGKEKEGRRGTGNHLQLIHRVPSSPELTSSPGKNRPQGKQCPHISSSVY